MTQKKIVVTGGAGFLGSHLCKRLLDQGHYVIALDNLYTGRMENLADVLSYEMDSGSLSGMTKICSSNSRFKFVNHDIIYPIDDTSLIIPGTDAGSKTAIDWILNFACPASPPHYQKDPIFTTKTSVLGIINMLELAKKHNARILHASTSEVYGDPLEHPQKESYRGNVNPLGPRACYDEGKRCAESLIFDYKRMFDLDVKIVRIFNTYGPNMDPNDGRVVSNFIVQALANQPLTMYGNGTQSRSFCYVDDLIDGILTLMNTEKGITGPVNIGNPHEFTLLELAQQVKELTGCTQPLVFKPLPEDDPVRRRPDITLAKQLLGWEPKVALRDGLVRTIEYFKYISSQESGFTRPHGQHQPRKISL